MVQQREEFLAANAVGRLPQTSGDDQRAEVRSVAGFVGANDMTHAQQRSTPGPPRQAAC